MAIKHLKLSSPRGFTNARDYLAFYQRLESNNDIPGCYWGGYRLWIILLLGDYFFPLVLRIVICTARAELASNPNIEVLNNILFTTTSCWSSNIWNSKGPSHHPEDAIDLGQTCEAWSLYLTGFFEVVNVQPLLTTLYLLHHPAIRCLQPAILAHPLLPAWLSKILTMTTYVRFYLSHFQLTCLEWYHWYWRIAGPWYAASPPFRPMSNSI